MVALFDIYERYFHRFVGSEVAIVDIGITAVV